MVGRHLCASKETPCCDFLISFCSCQFSAKAESHARVVSLSFVSGTVLARGRGSPKRRLQLL